LNIQDPVFTAAVGIDVGKKSLFVCLAIPGTDSKSWPVYEVDLTTSGWYRRFLNLIPQGALICHEPTGWAYCAPIRAAFAARDENPTIYLVNHHASAASRKLYVSRAKNDKIDARAIARIAFDMVRGESVEGVRMDDPQLQNDVLSLRLLLNQRRRTNKFVVRLSNQLDALAHSIWPSLAIKKSTYLRAVSMGAITPSELHELASREKLGIRGGFQSSLKKMVEDMPIRDINPFIVASIRSIYSEYENMSMKREALDSAIEEMLLTRWPDITARWMGVPNAGYNYVAALIVATNGMFATMTPSQFKAAVGVAPHTGISGSIDRTRKGRGGNMHSKDALHMWAFALISETAPENPIRRYFKSGHNLAHCKRKLADILSGIARAQDGAWRG
jgi:transposase